MVDEIRLGDRVYKVDFRGAPPFERDIVVIDEALLAEALSIESFARFEEVDDDAEADGAARRSGPPGKTHVKP